MTLIKADIIRAVSDRTGFTRKKSRHTVNTLSEIIKSTLESGEPIRINHFGKFDVKEKMARRWRSPFSGTVMTLPAKRVVSFKCFKRLKDKINAVKERVKSDKLKKILENHRRWLDSEGQKGQRAILAKAALAEADLYAAYLSRVNLQGADLRGADLSEADLYEANLQDTNLVDAILEWASLDGANLQGASLQGADLRWANLEGSNLTGANLRWANFEGANLKGAKLREADLYGTNLRNTDMEGAILTGIKLDYETQINLPKTIFDKYRQTFRVLEWSPTLAAPA
jgi:nucleoid DNA-binding protein